tara:strand:- start:190 stop:915 length:726 start_codon:yes stop_codon:yes gene_type:complete
MNATVFKEIVLELKNLSIGYDLKKPILENVNLEIEKGEIIGLVGPSGAGKTTLLKTIASIIPQISGEICILGECCAECVPSGNIGYIPQRLGLVNNKTVMENVVFGHFHKMNFFDVMLSNPNDEVLKEATEILESLEISEKANDQVKFLSGGERKRVAVARTLLQKPKIILADEFLGELDDETSISVGFKMFNYVKKNGSSIIFVDHNPARAMGVSDKIFKVCEKKVIELGKKEQDVEISI